MSETDSWLQHYEDTHQDLAYPMVYWGAVPMVVLGTVGVFWALPIPDQFFEISPLLNWGTAFLMATAVYYFIISVSLAIGMLPFLLGDRIVGRVDLKTDRKANVLRALAVWGEPGVDAAEVGAAMRAELDVLADMVGVNGVEVGALGNLADAAC